MNFNIHPIFVHFPIAFLLVYSVIKIFPFKKWFPLVAWKDIERILLIVGVAGSFAALSTGEIAENLVRSNQRLIDTHAFFGSFSTWIYGLLFVGEFASWILSKNIAYNQRLGMIPKFLGFVERFLCNKAFSIFLAIVGLIAISITGMLGGIITYGVSADPIAPFLLKALGIQI